MAVAIHSPTMVVLSGFCLIRICILRIAEGASLQRRLLCHESPGVCEPQGGENCLRLEFAIEPSRLETRAGLGASYHTVERHNPTLRMSQQSPFTFRRKIAHVYLCDNFTWKTRTPSPATRNHRKPRPNASQSRNPNATRFLFAAPISPRRCHIRPHKFPPSGPPPRSYVKVPPALRQAIGEFTSA